MQTQTIEQDDQQFKVNQIRRQVHREAGFYRHLATYVLVISGLWLFNFLTVQNTNSARHAYAYWAIWPTLFWGIGIASHAARVFLKRGWFGSAWQEKQIQARIDQARGR